MNAVGLYNRDVVGYKPHAPDVGSKLNLRRSGKERLFVLADGVAAGDLPAGKGDNIRIIRVRCRDTCSIVSVGRRFVRCKQLTNCHLVCTPVLGACCTWCLATATTRRH